MVYSYLKKGDCSLSDVILPESKCSLCFIDWGIKSHGPKGLEQVLVHIWGEELGYYIQMAVAQTCGAKVPT